MEYIPLCKDYSLSANCRYFALYCSDEFCMIVPGNWGEHHAGIIREYARAEPLKATRHKPPLLPCCVRRWLGCLASELRAGGASLTRPTVGNAA
jgi:hypothetical protein